MGKGDLRTRRGKIYRGTHGNTRPKGTGEPAAVAKPAAKPTKPAKK